MTDSRQLLTEFVSRRSEPAFRELVERYVNLVHSVALRLASGDTHLAEDVTQIVFADLAAMAPKLPERVLLGGWLHQHTCFVTTRTLRTERRRRIRERQAAEMNSQQDHMEANLARIAPILDEAIGRLGTSDRTAIILRYFEQYDLRSVGEALGTTEDAAQKRLSRALEKLHVLLKHRGATLSAAALGTALATEAVTAAPASLAGTISSAAFLAGTTITSTITATKAIAMTTLQKTLVTAALAALAGAGIYEAHQAWQLRRQNQALQQQQAPLANQLHQLQREHDDATNRLAALTDELARVNKTPSDVLKLRGEVGALRQEKAAADSQNTISKALANPETRKAIREHNRTVASGIYSGLAKRLKLTPEQTGQFDDLLADHAMGNIDLVMQALRDGKSQVEVRRIFSASGTAFQDKVQALLGDDALTQYQDYTKNLGSTLFINAFGASLTGDPATVADKKSRLLQAMQEATQSALAAAGLPADYQTLVAANPCNFASEDEAAYNLQLKDNILAQTAAKASTFLNADELNKLQEARTSAIKYSQNYILMERKLLAPISQ